MSDNNDIERRLQTLASEPVPPVDATFVDHLDVRLRLMHVDELGATRSRRMWIPALAGTIVLVVLAVAGAFLLSRTDNTAVILTAAADTDVILPGDEATAAIAGLHLPDGTRIIVGLDGEAVVDGVVLGPGSEALVVGDHVDIVVTRLDAADPTDDAASEPLVVESYRNDDPADRGDGGRDESPTTAATGDNQTSTSVSGNADRPVATDRDTDPGDDDGGVVTVTTRGQSSSTSSPTTVDPTSTSPPRPTSSTTTRTSTTADDKPRSPLELTVERIDRDRLRLDWALNRDIDPAGWRIRVRHGDRVTTVVVIRDGNARMTTIERSVVAGGSVWVEALDRQGHVLVASDPVDIGDS